MYCTHCFPDLIAAAAVAAADVGDTGAVAGDQVVLMPAVLG